MYIGSCALLHLITFMHEKNIFICSSQNKETKNPVKNEVLAICPLDKGKCVFLLDETNYLDVGIFR